MATLKMKKLRLVGLLEDKDAIVNAICRLGSIEVEKPPVIEHTREKHFEEAAKEAVAEKLTRLNNAIDFVGEQTAQRMKTAKAQKDKTVKAPPGPAMGLRGKAPVDVKDFFAVEAKEQAVFEGVVAVTEQLAPRVKELEAQTAALKQFVPKKQKAKKGVLPVETAEQKQYAVLEKERQELVHKIFLLNEKMPDTKMLYDYLGFELQKIELTNKLAFTDSVFILDGWLPAASETTVNKELLGVSQNIDIEFSEAEAEDKIPTLQKHNKFTEPYAMVAGMYSAPSAREVDPVPVMSVFYMFLFGIMLADFFYGLIVFLACFALLKKMKPTGGGKKLLQVIMMGGISGMFWGIMLGGYLGISANIPIFETILGGDKWNWLNNGLLGLNPMSRPLEMLLMSVIVGTIHISFALGLKAAQKFKEKKPLQAIFDPIPWILVLLGIALLVFDLMWTMLQDPAGAMGLSLGLMTGTLILAGIGLVMILISGIFLQKKVFVKIVGGIPKLYNFVGFFSDLLSYARLFGLALAGGVIAMVFNILGFLFVGDSFATGWYMLPLTLVVMAIGHTLNLALSVMGCYVHDSRLQYIEFFKNFYKGEGRIFKPLGSETKHTLIINNSLSADINTKK